MSIRQILGKIGLWISVFIIVSPALLFFIWMLSLSIKFEIDNASFPPILIPDRFAWQNYADVLKSNRFVTYFFNTLIVTGSATLAGNSTTLAGWTDSTSATPPRSVTAPVDGTYVLTLSCSNTGGSVTSLPATVVASTGGGTDNCINPQNRLSTSNIAYVPSSGTRTGVDVTSWDNIWGHSTASDTAVSWPGRHDSQPSILSFDRNKYIAAKIVVPPGQTASYGWIVHTEYNYGLDLTTSISTTCGDFNPANPLCKTVATSGMNLTPWRVGGTNFCPLLPGQTYYFNIEATNPAQGTTTCSASSPTCVIGTSNNFSP